MYFDVSKKTKYALLALIELAFRGPEMPLNARKLSSQNNLPARFLEVILNELKQGGFVASIRGKAGGYVLSRPSKDITIAQVLGFLETRSAMPEEGRESLIPGHSSVNALIAAANSAVSAVLERCTLEEMVQREMQYRSAFESNYVI